MNKNCHWIHLPFFCFWILRQCEDLWKEKRCLLVKSDTYFSNGPKCQRLHFLNPLRGFHPQMLLPWGEAESSQAIWGEKNFCISASRGWGSETCWLRRFCLLPLLYCVLVQGTPKCQRTDQQLRWRKPKETQALGGLLCRLLGAMPRSRAGFLFGRCKIIHAKRQWMDGRLRWDLSICVICIQALRMSWRQADGHFLEMLSSEWSLCSLASRGCDLDPCFVLALLRIQAYQRAFVAFLCNCMRFHALRSPTKTLVRCLQFFALGRQACGS